MFLLNKKSKIHKIIRKKYIKYEEYREDITFIIIFNIIEREFLTYEKYKNKEMLIIKKLIKYF
jgi:hypothetical protein